MGRGNLEGITRPGPERQTKSVERRRRLALFLKVTKVLLLLRDVRLSTFVSVGGREAKRTGQRAGGALPLEARKGHIFTCRLLNSYQ